MIAGCRCIRTLVYPASVLLNVRHGDVGCVEERMVVVVMVEKSRMEDARREIGARRIGEAFLVRTN